MEDGEVVRVVAKTTVDRSLIADPVAQIAPRRKGGGELVIRCEVRIGGIASRLENLADLEVVRAIASPDRRRDPVVIECHVVVAVPSIYGKCIEVLVVIDSLNHGIMQRRDEGHTSVQIIRGIKRKIAGT